ncbi:N-formylmaleamate deformylase [Pigmentiphaga humi]|uniref:N-formylmaleamate deformylase n=1 Tax=Pigmentiphaga humi TaxID=2478468 RepID=A0A3P4AZI7_9BURK|nr:alpha/beta hydrolase [Pigmentiphaga humi]VCU68900.1 N-formylmaleamate deformylase [Pigmentiphaga humi]
MSSFLYGAHVRANGIRQHYLRFGGMGAPLIVIPGVVTPAALWQHVAENLGRFFDTYVLDVRGRGLSESGTHLDYGLDTRADDLAAFIEAMKLDGVTLVGHSMGARIALRLTRRPSLAVRRVLLLDPPASGPGRRPYPIPMERSIRLVEASKRGEGVAYLRAPGVAPWPEPLLLQRAEWVATCDTRAVEAAYRDFYEHDPFDDLRRTSADVTLLVAGGSGVVSAEDIQEFLRMNPRLATHVIAGAAHQFQAENYGEFMDALGGMLGVALI